MDKCLYDILEVDRDATTEEIKKQYRVLALKYHPDKNLDRAAEYTKLFQEMKAAYEILSDPNERAWYFSCFQKWLLLTRKPPKISRRTRTLLTCRLGFLAVGIISDNSTRNRKKYYNQVLFNEYDDSDDGFYTVYRKCFDDLIVAEMESSKSSESGLPGFGDSKSPWNDVKKFYDHWDGLSSKRDFGFAEKYRLSDAPTRRIRRMMEKENAKEKKKAKKKYLDQIDSLVTFVRGMDPRVKEHQEMLEEENARKRENIKERRERAKLERDRKLEKGLEDFKIYLEEDNSNQADYFEIWKEKDDVRSSDEFKCEACNKKFKSESQWNNHNNSRKHLMNMRAIREEVAFAVELDQDSQEEVPRERTSRKKKKKRRIYETVEAVDESLFSMSEEIGSETQKDAVDVQETPQKVQPKSRRRKKKDKSQLKFECRVCGEMFQTRNSLFSHLKEKGHEKRQ